MSAKPCVFPCPFPCPFLPPPTLSQKPLKEAAASATGRAVWMSALCPQHGPGGGAGWWRGESMAGKGPHLSCLGCPCRDPAHLLRLGGLSKNDHVLGPQHLAPRFSGLYLTRWRDLTVKESWGLRRGAEELFLFVLESGWNENWSERKTEAGISGGGANPIPHSYGRWSTLSRPH